MPTVFDSTLKYGEFIHIIRCVILMSDTSEVQDELEMLLSQAKGQPGVATLMAAYGRAEEYIEEVNYYLSLTEPEVRLTSATSTS